jgi:hypothetical protein
VGLVLAVIARWTAVRGPNGATGLATAGIVLNGVLVVLAAVVIAVYGVAIVGVTAARRARDVHSPKPSASGAGTASVPSNAVGPSPAAQARIGETVRVGDLILAVLAYSEMDKCPSGDQRRAAQGAKFVLVQARMRNAGAEVIHIPRVRWSLGKYDEGGGGVFGACALAARRAYRAHAIRVAAVAFSPALSARGRSSLKSMPWSCGGPRRDACSAIIAA